jgi:hypothetical protein
MSRMRTKLFAALITFAALLAVCSSNIQPVYASSPYEGDSTSVNVPGVRGVNTGITNGGLGLHGVSGTPTSSGTGVKGEDSHGGYGVQGFATGTTGGYGVYGSAANDLYSVGVRGDSGSGAGVFGYASASGGKGLSGYADTNAGYAVYGAVANNSAWAGYFTGSSKFLSTYPYPVVTMTNTAQQNWPVLEIDQYGNTQSMQNANGIHIFGANGNATGIAIDGFKYGVSVSVPAISGAGAAALNASGGGSGQYGAYITNSAGTALYAATGGGATGIAIDCANAIKVGGALFSSGTGSPNGVVLGVPGDVYTNKSGGAGATWWVKESGSNTNTGWVAK